MVNLVNRIIAWVTILFFLFLYGALLFRFLRSRFGKSRTVTAKVVGKQTVERFSKYGKKTQYAVTFLVEGKNMSFYVSELSYGGYRKGEVGKLTYRGDRLIDFH